MTPPPRLEPDATRDRRPGRGAAARRGLQAFYLATPAFALLDLAAGVNLRTTFLDDAPGLKLLYYASAFTCGLAVSRWPRRAALVGLLESGINVGWLAAGVVLRYLAALDAVLGETTAAAAPLTVPETLNLVVSAAVLMVSHVAAQAGLVRGRP